MMGQHPAVSMARAFLAMGGRLMIDPIGRYESSLDLSFVFGPAGNQANYDIARAFAQMQRQRGPRRALRRLVTREGLRLANGWQVMEGTHHGRA